jgi:hypothetical protein
MSPRSDLAPHILVGREIFSILVAGNIRDEVDQLIDRHQLLNRC